MIGLIIAIILFNSVAFLTIKRLTTNQIVHIWTFTISFQSLVDLYLDFQYKGYWYFTANHIEWFAFLPLTMVIPPVNTMFLNWYPFHSSLVKRFIYTFLWVLFILFYESLTLLPEPWGYFHYGWWKLGYSAICDPILLMLVLIYYKWIRKIEKSANL